MEIDDLRRRAPLLRALAETRLVRVEDGPGVGGRLLQVRAGELSLDLALDRGGDIVRLAWRGVEIGWHAAAREPAPPPDQDAEDGLGTMRGFDGFLVTCGLDHHGPAARSDAGAFLYPLRGEAMHPLHGRLMSQRAEVARRETDWEAGTILIRLVVHQAAVFGEAFELVRDLHVGIHQPHVTLRDRVTNRGFRPTRHGLLYHVNVGWPLLDRASRLTGDGWTLRDRLDGTGAVPEDDHVEVVDIAASPPAGPDGSGWIGVANPGLGTALCLGFDPVALPKTALWRAFQSGTFALGLEPQTEMGADPVLPPGASRLYGLNIAFGAT